MVLLLVTGTFHVDIKVLPNVPELVKPSVKFERICAEENNSISETFSVSPPPPPVQEVFVVKIT